MTNKGVSEVRKGTWDNTELLLQLLQLNVSVDFCWIVNNNITVLRRTAKQFGGRTVITNNNALYITWGGSRVRYRMNYCRWKKSVLSKFCTMHKNWWSLSCEFRLIAYLYNVITAFLVIVPLPPLGGQGYFPTYFRARPGRVPSPSSSIAYQTTKTLCTPVKKRRFSNWTVGL